MDEIFYMSTEIAIMPEGYAPWFLWPVLRQAQDGRTGDTPLRGTQPAGPNYKVSKIIAPNASKTPIAWIREILSFRNTQASSTVAPG